MDKYRFRKYTPKYKPFFTTEKTRLARILGPSAKIEHIGSTAIPGLGGKGILDIAVGISKSKLSLTKKKLENAGYEFHNMAGTSERLFFVRDYPYNGGKRRVHLHLTKFKGPEWNGMIGFRDYLLKHPEAVKSYAKLKKDAVKKAKGKGEIYKKHKEKFIKQIINCSPPATLISKE